MRKQNTAICPQSSYSDTVWLNVYPGIDQTDFQHLNVASYSDKQQIVLTWDKLPGAKHFNIYRGYDHQNLKFIASTAESLFIDSVHNPDLYIYKIVAIDSCGKSSSSGRYARPVLLQGEIGGINNIAVLSFSSYQLWQDSKISYELQYFDTGIWQSIQNSSDTTDLSDYDFLMEGKSEKCYRIKASNSEFSSYSNTVCLDYKPIIFLPNAFSPNGDGLNDSYKPITFGIDSYTCEIYNRWGQLIAVIQNGESWNAEDIPQGTYMIRLTATGNNQVLYFQTGTVHVLK